MHILALLISVIPLLASATFVDLDKPNVTLRRHYHTILKYTTLHRFGRTVTARMRAASTRNDAVGELARIMRQLRNPTVKAHRTQLAYSSFYALVWAMRSSQWRTEADLIWADTLEAVKQVSTCKHCPVLIDRYLGAYQQGKASVYGSRFGRGRLARQIVDNPKACFLKRPQLRRILREMEIKLVRLYLQHLPRRLENYLAGAYQVEAQAMENALATPVDAQAEAVDGGAGAAGEVAPAEYTPAEKKKWRQWLHGLKERVKGKWSSVKSKLRTIHVHRPTIHHRPQHDQCGCHQQQHQQNHADTQQADTQQADTQQADAQQADTQQADTHQADAQQADTQQEDAAHHARFMEWLQHVRKSLSHHQNNASGDHVILEDGDSGNATTTDASGHVIVPGTEGGDGTVVDGDTGAANATVAADSSTSGETGGSGAVVVVSTGSTESSESTGSTGNDALQGAVVEEHHEVVTQ